VSYPKLLAKLRFMDLTLCLKLFPHVSDSVDHCLPSVLHQVVLLSALIISAAATAAGVFEAYQLSIYLRVLVPVVFTR
jgi:hypothetical protein